MNFHPAGKKIMTPYLGKDASSIFNYFHAKNIEKKYRHLVIGTL